MGSKGQKIKFKQYFKEKLQILGRFAIFSRRSYPLKAEFRSSYIRGIGSLAIFFHANVELSQCL